MKYTKIVLFSIILLGVFLRFYKLDKYPVQLNHDEISQIYDTASIVKTGKDIYGNFLPLAFPSTGDFKVGHYIYITVIPYLIFGVKEVVIRLPAAFFGSLTIFGVYLFVNQLLKNVQLALIASFLVAVTPSEIFYSRKSFESIIAESITFFGLFMLVKLREVNRSKSYLLLTALFLVLPMYIYTSYTMVIPLIILLFSMIYWKEMITKLKVFGVACCILIIPLSFIVLSNQGVRFRANSVFILRDFNLVRQLNLIDGNSKYISSLLKFGFVVEYSFTKYINQLDLKYLFANGLDLTNKGVLGLGPLLFIQLPFFTIGVLLLIKDKYKKEAIFLLGALLISFIPSGLTFEQTSPHRSVLAFTFISIISAIGVWETYKFSKNFSRLNRTAVAGLIIFSFFINIIYCIHIYTANYPNEKSQQLHYPYKLVAQYAWSNYGKYDHIIIDPVYGESAPVRAVAVHYYLAYYGNYDPFKFQKDLKLDNVGINFDKFSIREIDWRKDSNLKKTLIIASPWSLPESVLREKTILKTFNFYDKKIAFYAIELE